MDEELAQGSGSSSQLRYFGLSKWKHAEVKHSLKGMDLLLIT